MIKRLLVFALVIVLLGLLSVYYPVLTGEVVSDWEKEKVFVIRVIDGDTIETDIGKVRLLGVNTPEKGKEHYSEAKDYLKVVENKSVEILRDFEDSDKYGRKLRYLFFEGGLINAEILQEGLGTRYMAEGLKYEDRLVSAEKFAQMNNKGLWVRSSEKCADCIELAELNAEEEFFILRNNCSFDCDLEGWLVKDNANHFFNLKKMSGGEVEKYESKSHVWNNEGDRFFMRDRNGKLAVFYEY